MCTWPWEPPRSCRHVVLPVFCAYCSGMDALHDPGTATGLARTAAVEHGSIVPLTASSGARLLVGVASWTDPSMTAPGVFYPDRMTSPEARLRYYATRFPLVEVDSTYYA